MRLIIAALFFMISTVAQADEAWKIKALEEVKNYPRVKSAQWAESGALWLFANKADVVWDNIISQVICFHLYEAGKPDNETVLVNFFSFEGSANGTSERMGSGLCE